MTTEGIEARRERARNLVRRRFPGTRETYFATLCDDHYSYTTCLAAARQRRSLGLAESGMTETAETELDGEIIAAMLALPRPINLDVEIA